MEIWKDIPGFEGLYQVSNMGNVKSLNYNRTGKERKLKPDKKRNGYLYVILRKDKKSKHCYIHSLVAKAFISNPGNKPCIDHIDNDKENNRTSNLRWVNHKENMNNEITKAKQTNGKFAYCIELDKIFCNLRDAEKELGIAHQHISAACNGKRKSAGKHPITGERLHWKYIELLPCYN